MIRWSTVFSVVCMCGCGILAQTVTWTDISTTLINQLAAQGKSQGPGGSGFNGCAGVAVNRLNGDLYIKVIALGIWKSTNKGQSFVQVDNGTVTGRDEAGAAFTLDQNNPTRMASFSLDGTAGFTADGTTWKKFTDIGRNWDVGSVDWGTANAKIIVAIAHESGGKVYKSTDAGTTWNQMNITVDDQNNNTKCMIGVMDPTNIVYSNGSGIMHSADGGSTWSSASSKDAMTKFPVLFNGAHYVGTATGLLKSTDKGATWQTLGSATEIIQGPFFGADENTMVIVGSTGFFRTINAGTTWTKIAPLKPNDNYYNFDPKWWGCYAWDPINSIVYASAMNNPCWAAAVSPTGVNRAVASAPSALRNTVQTRLQMAVGGRVNVSNLPAAARSVKFFDVNGRLIGQSAVGANSSAQIDQNDVGHQAILVRAE